MNSQHWHRYFESNATNRPEPQWNLPLPDDKTLRRKLAASLSHFQLGESGDGGFLLAQAEKDCPDDPTYFKALALFIKEEQEHARLLRLLVERFGGTVITRHWTHALFRLARRALGLKFEIQVLVIAELVGTAYYRILHLRTHDPVLEQICALLLRDEAKHIEFHSDRLIAFHERLLPAERAIWCAQFQALFLAAATVAWLDHGACLAALGSRREEFFKEARKECIQFLDKVTGAVLTPPHARAAFTS
jgi:hypothetical protein